MPLLFVWGDDDTMVPATEAEVLHEHMADVRLVVVPDAGHAPYFEVPAVFNAAVLDFVR